MIIDNYAYEAKAKPLPGYLPLYQALVNCYLDDGTVPDHPAGRKHTEASELKFIGRSHKIRTQI